MESLFDLILVIQSHKFVAKAKQLDTLSSVVESSDECSGV